MPKPLERLLTAGKQAKWTFGAGFATITGGSGLLAATGTGAAATAAIAAAPVVIVAGGALMAGAAVYCGFRALFPRNRRAFHDQPVALNDLNYKFWSCHIFRVAVVGIKRAGKTEIKARLRTKSSGDRDTERIETHIFEVDAVNKIFVAFIDGRGADSDERRQQFEIADRSEILVVVVDHNDTDKAPDISDDRLEEHEGFLKQMLSHLKTQRHDSPLEKVFFLLNKKDIWEHSDEAPRFRQWFDDIISEWKDTAISYAEQKLEVSAFNPADIESLKEKIIDAAKEAASER